MHAYTQNRVAPVLRSCQVLNNHLSELSQGLVAWHMQPNNTTTVDSLLGAVDAKERDLFMPAFVSVPHKHILVTGPPGSGKTYVSAALRKLGINAPDADTIDELCGWFDKSSGKRVQYPKDADKAFLDNHAFRWERTVLHNFLGHQKRVYLFGSSSNIFVMFVMFHRVFFLRAPPELLTQRLRSKERANPMGRTDYQLKYCLCGARMHEELAYKLNIPMLDATESPERMFSRIHEEAGI